jgi:hypothetical protein
MKPLSDTCRDKALAVSSSPFFYTIAEYTGSESWWIAGAGMHVSLGRGGTKVLASKSTLLVPLLRALSSMAGHQRLSRLPGHSLCFLARIAGEPINRLR